MEFIYKIKNIKQCLYLELFFAKDLNYLSQHFGLQILHLFFEGNRSRHSSERGDELERRRKDSSCD